MLREIPAEATRTDFAAARPHEMPSDIDWDTAYGRYLKGVQMLRNCEYTNGVACLESCLRKEPNFAPALDANVHSPDAVLACLVAYRKLNSPGAVESLARIFEHEQPLCPGVAYERGRLKTDDDVKVWSDALKALRSL